MKTTTQLELGLDSKQTSRKTSTTRRRHLQRAHWWFQQMHRAVDRSAEWESAPTSKDRALFPTP